MQFYRRFRTKAKRLGVLPGGFNPPTIAHVALANAAAAHVDEVLCVVPREYPHKQYFGATLDQRIEMIEASNWNIPCSIAVTDRGLFIDMARECRVACGPETRLLFLCGRDAAERILNWDYGREGVVQEMLREFGLLVAARHGEFSPPDEFAGCIHALEIPPGYGEVSSTGVRERIARGEAWEHLVPGGIVDRVRKIYS